MDKIRVTTTKRSELIDITKQVQAAAVKEKIESGVCVVFCPHTTAGLTINENADPSVKRDIISTLGDLIPEGGDYGHSEGNSDSHIKSSLFGSSLSVIVEKGQLCLGTWQGVYFCESDGPREREVWVKIVAEK
jgi:secondary thiamine-phosphate synthase enzyme